VAPSEANISQIRLTVHCGKRNSLSFISAECDSVHDKKYTN